MLRRAPFKIYEKGVISNNKSSLLGQEYCIRDAEYGDRGGSGGVISVNSDLDVWTMLVVNVNSSNLTPGQIVKWATDSTYGPFKGVNSVAGEDAGNQNSLDLEATQWRVHDAVGTFIGTAGNDDLGVASGTYGTDTPTVQAGDVGGASPTRYARRLLTLPLSYVAGTDLTIRMNAGMLTTVADTSAALDVQVFLDDEDGTAGAADLCETAAQSINSLTFADKDFTIDGSGLSPGDTIDIRISIAAVDSGDAGVMIPEIADAEVLYQDNGETGSLAGVVSPFIPSAGVAQYETFMLVTKGPTKVQWDGSASFATKGLRMATAATGRVRLYDPENDDPFHMIGQNLATKTSGSAGDLFRAYVDFKRQW